MQIFYISIFPEIFESFLSTSLIQKAQQKGILQFKTINPRDFTQDKHKQVDDEVYGHTQGMLMKAEPVTKAVLQAVSKIKNSNFKIILLKPSKKVFSQKIAQEYSKYENLIFVCGRYEGIDYRFELFMKDKFGEKFETLSVGKFVVMGGEIPAMLVTEAVVRLIPGVVGNENSVKQESYTIKEDYLEPPKFTRPAKWNGYKVPAELLTGNPKDEQKREKKFLDQ